MERTYFKQNGRKCIGIKISDWLVVGIDDLNRYYKIYRIHDGEPFINLAFDTLDDAVRVANWLEITYRDFFPIWEAMPKADLIELCQWTIKNGIEVANLMKMLQETNKGKIISAQAILGEIQHGETIYD